jgi:hypothetical protein
MAIITEIKTIKIDCACKDNPVYLQWRGTNGGINYWLFHSVQTEVETSSVKSDFFPYVGELEDAFSNEETLSKGSQPSLIVGGYIDVEDLGKGFKPSDAPGLKGLIRSLDVSILMNPETWQDSAPQWMRVKVAPGTFKILDTNQTKAQIEFTLLLPSINIQTQ